MAKRPFTGTVEEFALFCAVNQVAAGNALAGAWDHDDGSTSFDAGVRLSSTGQEPATYIGHHTVADTGMNQGIESAIITGTPWLSGYKYSEGWTWETALADMGLQVIYEGAV